MRLSLWKFPQQMTPDSFHPVQWMCLVQNSEIASKCLSHHLSWYTFEIHCIHLLCSVYPINAKTSNSVLLREWLALFSFKRIASFHIKISRFFFFGAASLSKLWTVFFLQKFQWIILTILARNNPGENVKIFIDDQKKTSSVCK